MYCLKKIIIRIIKQKILAKRCLLFIVHICLIIIFSKQEDLGGSLFNLNEYFPTTDCANIFLGRYKLLHIHIYHTVLGSHKKLQVQLFQDKCYQIISGYATITELAPSLSNTQVVDDSGSVQRTLGGLLPAGQQFYVNAESGNISYLYKYSPDSASENEIFHYSPNGEGACLTFSKSDSGYLESKG